MKKVITSILLLLSIVLLSSCSSSDNDQPSEKDKLVGNWKHIKMIVNNTNVIDDCRKKSFGSIDENLNFKATLYRPTANDCRIDVFQNKITKVGDFNYTIDSEYKIKLTSNTTFELVQGNSNVTDIWEKQ